MIIYECRPRCCNTRSIELVGRRMGYRLICTDLYWGHNGDGEMQTKYNITGYHHRPEIAWNGIIFFPQSDWICKIRLRMCETHNTQKKHSTPPTTSCATPPSHIPFTLRPQHPNSHPTRNMPSHLPAQHLPPHSAIKHHQGRPGQHPPQRLPATPTLNLHQQHSPDTIKYQQQHPHMPSDHQATPQHPPQHLPPHSAIKHHQSTLAMNNSPSNILHESPRHHPATSAIRHQQKHPKRHPLRHPPQHLPATSVIWHHQWHPRWRPRKPRNSAITHTWSKNPYSKSYLGKTKMNESI